MNTATTKMITTTETPTAISNGSIGIGTSSDVPVVVVVSLMNQGGSDLSGMVLG